MRKIYIIIIAQRIVNVKPKVLDVVFYFDVALYMQPYLVKTFFFNI